MRDLLLVGFLFVAIYYSFKKPYIGVAAWIWIALTAPAKWAFGFSTSFRMNLTIVLITALAYFFVQKNKSYKFNGLSFWVLMFGLWTLVSTSANLALYSSAVWSYWIQFLKVLALFVFITLVVKKKVHVNTLVWALVLSISAYAGMEGVKFILSGGGHRIIGRAGIIEDRNDLAVAINMCIPLIIYLITTVKNKNLKLGLYGLLGLNVVAVVGTYSRGAFIGLTILAIAFWLKTNKKFVVTIAALIIIPIAFSFAPQSWKERQTTVKTASSQDGSFIGRLWAWKVSTMIALDNPLTGGGFNAVMDYRLWGTYAPFTPDFMIPETPPVPAHVKAKAAHNIYFQVLGDHGFVGLIIFCFILLMTFVSNAQNRRFARDKEQEWLVKFSGAISLSMVGYCITGANVSLAYFDLLYAIVGIVAAIQANLATMVENASDKENSETVPSGNKLGLQSTN